MQQGKALALASGRCNPKETPIVDLAELIGKLRNVQSNYPGCKVVVATSAQVSGGIPGMNAAFRLPIADGSCLGDQNGEVGSLFIVTVR